MSALTREQEWEKRKCTLWELGVRDGLSIPKLKTHFDQLGFVASADEYRNKFVLWGFHHNLSKPVWKYIGYETKKRKRGTGHDWDVFVSGIRLPPIKVARETSRHFLTQTEMLNPSNLRCPSGYSVSLSSPSPIPADTFCFDWPSSLPWVQFSQYLPFPTLSSPDPVPAVSLDSISLRLGLLTASPSSINISHFATHLGALMPERFKGEHVLHSQCLTRGSESAAIFAVRLLLYQLSNNMDVDDQNVVDLIDRLELTKFLSSFSSATVFESLTAKAALSRLFGVAVRKLRSDIMAWLLGLGVDPNRKQLYRGRSELPFEMVADITYWSTLESSEKQRNWSKAVDLLMTYSFDMTSKCCQNHEIALRRALHAAARISGTEALDHLIQCGIQKGGVIFLSKLNWGSLYSSADTPCRQYILDLYASKIGPFAHPSDTPICPEEILMAVRSSNIPFIKYLGRIKANLNCHNERGIHPLMCALETQENSILQNRFMVFRSLMEAGSSLSYQGIDSRTSETTPTAFQQVVLSGDWTICRELLKFDVDPDALFYDHDTSTMATPLRHAASRGDWSTVQVLLDSRAAIEGDELLILMRKEPEDGYGWEYHATIRDVTDKFVAAGFDPNTRSTDGKSAIEIALEVGLTDIALILIEAGGAWESLTSFTTQDWVDFTIDRVYLIGTDKCIKDLKRHAPNYPGHSLLETVSRLSIFPGTTFLSYSAEEYHYDTVVWEEIEMLPEVQKVLNEYPSAYSHDAFCFLLQPDPNTFEPLDGPDATRRLALANEILDRRPPTQTKDDDGRMHQQVGATVSSAVIHGNFELLEKALSNLPKSHSPVPSTLNCPFQFLWPPFTDAGLEDEEGEEDEDRHRRCLVLDRLVTAGYKIKTMSGLKASQMSSCKAFQQLMDYGLNPRRRYAWSPTFLQIAIRGGNTQLAKLLVKIGVDVNAVPPWQAEVSHFSPGTTTGQYGLDPYKFHKGTAMNIYSRTALQAAVEENNLELITLLLDSGANANAPAARHGGATALQLAAIKGFIGIAQMLLSKGADVNAEGAEFMGRTALEGAAENGRLDMVHLLIESGCNLHEEGRQQFIRAVVFARDESHYEVAECLEEMGSWKPEDEARIDSVFHDCCDKSHPAETHDWQCKGCPRQSLTWKHTSKCCDETESIDDSMSEPLCWEEVYSESDYSNETASISGCGSSIEQQHEDSHKTLESPQSCEKESNHPVGWNVSEQEFISERNEQSLNPAEIPENGVLRPRLGTPSVDDENFAAWNSLQMDIYPTDAPFSLTGSFQDATEHQMWLENVPFDKEGTELVQNLLEEQMDVNI